MSKKWRQQYADVKGAIIDKPVVGVLLAAGTTVPADATAGYAPGCLFIDTDAAAGAQDWLNTGSVTSSLFKALSAGGDSPTFTTLTATTGNITTVVSTAYTLSAGASTFTIKANTASAAAFTDGTTSILSLDTRNTIKNTHAVTITGVPVTVASEAAAHLNSSLNLAAKTITYSGTTTTTSSLGAMLNVGVPTFTDASVCTLTTASAVHISAIAAAGGSLTITNSRMISTSVTDCFLTNLGVWTDTACWESGKELVVRGTEAVKDAIGKILDQIVPATWKYRSESALPAIDEEGNPFIHRTKIDDRGRERAGIVYDDLPEALRCPGEERAVSPGILASFALAALKTLWDENNSLRSRLERLEAKVA